MLTGDDSLDSLGVAELPALACVRSERLVSTAVRLLLDLGARLLEAPAPEVLALSGLKSESVSLLLWMALSLSLGGALLSLQSPLYRCDVRQTCRFFCQINKGMIMTVHRIHIQCNGSMCCKLITHGFGLGLFGVALELCLRGEQALPGGQPARRHPLLALLRLLHIKHKE